MNSLDAYNALMRFASAVNRREQEKKLMAVDSENAANFVSHSCKHDNLLGVCVECAVEQDRAKYESRPQQNAVGSWAPPETTTARLKRLLFQLQCTQRSIAEAQAEIERVMASL